MEKPIIGLPGWKTGENSFGCTIPYIEFANRYGIPRVLTLQEDVDNNIDLLIIPGGSDIDSLRYNAIPNFNNTKPDPFKEYFDTIILPKYIEKGVPVFGICRGHQSIAVLFGAKLVQDMWHETNLNERSDRVHGIELTDTTFKRDFENKVKIKSYKFEVNSMHHQCVSTHDLPECLEIIGIYKGKKHYSSIEILRHKDLPIYSVQYHPEELTSDILSDHIIKTLLNI